MPSLALPSRTMSLEAFRGFRNLIPYHSIYRSLYYAPLAVAAMRYGQRGGALTAVATNALYVPMCDCTGQRLHQLLPKAQVKLLDQASHFAMLDQPEAFYRVLLDWRGLREYAFD